MTRRWMIVIVAVCLVAAVAAIAYAAGKTSAPKVLRAQRFELVDADGKVRAELALDRFDGPALVLMDTKGRLHASLGQMTNDGGPALYLWDGGIGPKVGVAVGEGTSQLILSDNKGRERVMLGLAEDGEPRLALLDEKGKVLWKPPRSIAEAREDDADTAVQLVREKPGGMSWSPSEEDPTPEEIVTHEMSCRGGTFDLIGWRAERVHEGLYLVSFTYRPADKEATITVWQDTPEELRREAGKMTERGWFWEVHLPTRITRFLSIEDFESARTRYGLKPVSGRDL